MNEQYISERVFELIKEPVHVSMLTKCGSGCGALVRLIGSDKERSWFCPLCGAGMPYAFWSVDSEKDAKGCSMPARMAKPEELIIQLNPEACVKCGELPECRCDRAFKSAVEKGLQSPD